MQDLFSKSRKVLSFKEADRIFRTKKGTKNSVELAPDVRLVQLAPDRYGVQVVNTYLLRIDQSGAYIVSFEGEPTRLIHQVLAKIGPVRLTKVGGYWQTQFGDRFKSPLVVDKQGHVFPSAQAA